MSRWVSQHFGTPLPSAADIITDLIQQQTAQCALHSVQYTLHMHMEIYLHMHLYTLYSITKYFIKYFYLFSKMKYLLRTLVDEALYYSTINPNSCDLAIAE